MHGRLDSLEIIGNPSDRISESSAYSSCASSRPRIRSVGSIALPRDPDSDRADRRQRVGYAEADASREISFQNQKPRHPRRVHVPQIIPPIRLDRAAASQHRHPVKIPQRAVENLFVGFENVIFRLDHPARDIRPLQIFRQLRELPSLIVRQRLIGQSLEQHRPGHHRTEKLIRRFIEPIRRIFAPKRPIKRVQILPHLRRNILANSPRVLTRPGQAVQNAVRILQIKRQILANTLRQIRPFRTAPADRKSSAGFAIAGPAAPEPDRPRRSADWNSPASAAPHARPARHTAPSNTSRPHRAQASAGPA